MGLFLKFTLQCKSLLDCRRGMVTSNQFPSFPGLSGGQTRASTPPPSPLAAHTRMQPNLVQTRKSSSGALSVGPQTSCTRIAWKQVEMQNLRPCLQPTQSEARDPAMVSTKPTWGLRCTLPFKATIQGPEDHLKRWSLMSGGAGRSVSVTSGGSSNGVQWGPQCPPRLDRVTQVPCPQSLSSVTPNPGG